MLTFVQDSKPITYSSVFSLNSDVTPKYFVGGQSLSLCCNMAVTTGNRYVVLGEKYQCASTKES